MKKRKVLIPLDGSAFSRRIIPVVRTHFKPAETDLVLLRVVLPPILPPGAAPSVPATPPDTSGRASGPRGRGSAVEHGFVWSAQEEEAYRAQVREELGNVTRELQALGYDVTVEVLFGEPAPSIIEYIKNSAIDLVAMTTHGRTGIGRFVLGSVADSVLRAVEVPVLLLRTATPPADAQPSG